MIYKNIIAVAKNSTWLAHIEAGVSHIFFLFSFFFFLKIFSVLIILIFNILFLIKKIFFHLFVQFKFIFIVIRKTSLPFIFWCDCCNPQYFHLHSIFIIFQLSNIIN